MLRTTFLGWQSWLIESDSTRVLLDPVLLDEVGRGRRGTRGRYTFWPPRVFTYDAIPEIDAIVLTHEHEDHLSVPTLARVDHRIPIYLPEYASGAAHTILKEMGFAVRPLLGGDTVRVGDLDLHFFCGDHANTPTIDEWTALAILVEHCAEDGHFFTNVDVAVSQPMIEALERLARRSDGMAQNILTYDRGTIGMWNEPVGAWEPEESEAPQFALTTKAFEVVSSGERVRPVPGQTMTLLAGNLTAIDSKSPFLTWKAPPSDWTPHSFWGAPDDAPRPRCGLTVFPEDYIPELEHGLRQLAEFMFDRPLFRRLYSFDRHSLSGRKPTFVWCLLADADGGAYVYEYRPSHCDFVAIEPDDDLHDKYVGVVISWSTDLLALFRGELDPRSIAQGYRAVWNPPCENAGFFSHVLWPFFHPLRHAEGCLRQYRATLAEERDAPVWIRARQPALDFPSDTGRLHAEITRVARA